MSAPIDDPLIGKQLANFRVERVIGRGGMAVVYYGIDVKLHRPVAIKVIDTRYRGDPSYARRFVEEARAVAAWRHENIIQVYYADDQDGFYYFVMEYIDGQDLAQLMAAYAAEGELMPLADVIRIGRGIASALDYAHQKGVIHRDVKPSNVIVAADGRPVLGDFGLALDIHRGSRGEVFGTAHYIAPEQACRSADAVPQSDLYSLGVILYEMLTGAAPFDDQSPTSVVLQHMTLPPPPPRSINPALNAETEAVLLKALSKNPADRYQTGAELMDALEKALAAPPPAEAPPSLPPPPAAIQTAAAGSGGGRVLSATTVAQRIAMHLQSPAGTLMPPAGAGQHTPPPGFAALRRRRSGILAAIAVLGLIGASALLISPTRRAFLTAWLIPPTGTPASTYTLTPTVTPTVTPTLSPSVTASPTHTVRPTRTSSPRPTATFTLWPTATTTMTETVGSQASITPTIPITATETATPESTPTATLDLSATPSPTQPSPTPTELTSGKKFTAYYNYNSFYLLNASPDEVDVTPLAFERLSLSGEVLNRFDGLEWARYQPVILPKTCMRLEIRDSSPYLYPEACHGVYRSSRFPYRTSSFVFWTKSAGSTQFRILWNEQEVKRCAIDAGRCDFYLP